ncbi:phage protein [Streptococcus pneumoniae]|nr:phage protein [Streptococcus pneumoniae]
MQQITEIITNGAISILVAFTFQSLIENYRKLKGNVTLFQPIVKVFQRLLEKDDDTKKGE